MSQRCDVCGKEPRFGNQVARLGRNAQRRRVLGRSARMFRPNIQTVKAIVDGPHQRAPPPRAAEVGSVLRQRGPDRGSDI